MLWVFVYMQYACLIIILSDNIGILYLLYITAIQLSKYTYTPLNILNCLSLLTCSLPNISASCLGLLWQKEVLAMWDVRWEKMA